MCVEKNVKPLQCVLCFNPVQNVCAPTHSLIQTLGSDERFMKSLRGVFIHYLHYYMCQHGGNLPLAQIDALAGETTTGMNIIKV